MSRPPKLKVALVGVNSPGYRSLALAYVRAYAQARRDLADVGFITLDLDTSLDAWWIAYRVIGLNPDVVALSVVCWNARIVYEVARVVRAALPDVTIVVGGPEVGPMAEDVLGDQPAIDAVVRGEGEETFAELLDARLHGRALWRVAGVTARRDGSIVSADDRPLIADLDSIPSPYLSGVLQPVDGGTYLETYRGCPHACAYCYEGKGYGRIRRFSEERVAAEIAKVASAPGVRSFSFIDPVFNLTRERLSWLADQLGPHAARGTRLHTVEIDIERVDAEEAALLHRAGVRSVETGPQSVGATALQTCRRTFDAERYRAGVAACREAGIRVEADLIVGLPGDTVDDVLAGIDFAIAADPGKVQMSTLHVLPGTELWNDADALGLAFDPQPPHEIVSNREIGFADLRRLEVLGNAAVALYGARLETDREEAR